MGNRRITGKNGQVVLEVGSTAVAGPTATTGNAAAEVVDGISYDPYQVWTLSVGGNIPQSPSTFPTVVVGGTGLPDAYTFEWVPLRGKLIFTPSLGSGATVSMSAYATPKLYAQGDTVDFDLNAPQEIVDASAQSQNWKTSASGQFGWSGKVTAHWKSTQFWDASAGNVVDVPVVMKLYPAKGIFTEYWLGAARIGWGIKIPLPAMVSQDITLAGDGPLIYLAS
jgi:hypothetical protein